MLSIMGFSASLLICHVEISKAAQFHPFLFLFAIEILATAVRSNDNIKGL